MKNLWKLMLGVIALLSMLLVLWGCSLGAQTHTCIGTTEVIEKEATCQAEGSKKFVCSCGKTVKTEKIPLAEHTEETVPGKAATCEETGLTDGKKCSVCEILIVAQESLPALGHDEISHDAKEPTCTEIGWDAYVNCSRCLYTTYEEKAIINHNMEDGRCTECDYPYIHISTVEDLQNVASNLSANYILMNNLDLGGMAWTPIGKSSSNSFTGTFDGNGYVIENFKITGDVEYAGLFGYNRGTIQNIGLENFTINVSRSGYYAYAGGLVGSNAGTITNCYATGDVSVRCIRNDSAVCVGGLVGSNDARYGDDATITNCYATGDVSASTILTIDSFSACAGGLVGDNAEGTIANCYATGNVSASAIGYRACAGGLVGLNHNGTITNSYATGEVSASGTGTVPNSTGVHAGGLVGLNHNGTITNSYATGEVSASSTGGTNSNAPGAYAGGLVGSNDARYGDNDATITNCYATGDISSISSAISAYTTAGGLVGENISGRIVNCYATGDVSDSAYAGGLVGYNFGNYLRDAIIRNCYATGNVSASRAIIYSACAGGLVGYNEYGNLAYCYATGDVSVSTTNSHVYAGGLVGYNRDDTITNSYRYSGQSFTVTENGTTTYSATNTEGTAKDMATLQSVSFQQNRLGWSADDWNFAEGAHPTLKNVGLEN